MSYNSGHMPAAISTLKYFSVVLPDKVGEGAKLLSALKEAGVNLTAAWGYPIKGKKAVVDLAPTDAKAFFKAAKKLKIEVSAAKSAFLWLGDDRPGALAAVLATLAEGGVNVHALQALAAGSRKYGAMLQVADEDFKKAKKLLGAK